MSSPPRAKTRKAFRPRCARRRAKGIKVITYDADALPDAREFFVNQATPQGIGYALMDEAARLCGNEGEFAVITGSLTAANQVEWRKYVEERRAAQYPEHENGRRAAVRRSQGQGAERGHRAA